MPALMRFAKTRKSKTSVWSELCYPVFAMRIPPNKMVCHVNITRSLTLCALAGAGILSLAHANAAGLYRDGASARSMGMGGASTAVADNPLDALESNAAALNEIHGPTLELGGAVGFVHGDFSNKANRGNVMNDDGLLGSAAVAIPAGPFRFGLGVNPDMVLRDRWQYRDAPGGADGATSYGTRSDASKIMVLRTSFGFSWQIVPSLSVGGSIGLLYNENSLHTPYVFQNQPVLRTAKTLLNLETSGYGYNVEGGVLWKPIPTVMIGANYTSHARVGTDGRASGNAGAQFANLGLGGARPDFAYDASVVNTFPQQVSVGAGWQVTPKLLLTAQMDWINWANSFNALHVRLKNGNNKDINGLLGSSSLNDDIPLDWRNQFVWRVGGEYAINENWTVRAGYSFSQNPVPPDTLLPMTAAITENTLTAGVGYHKGPFSIDLAYQWAIPNTVHVGQSAIESGEYSNSTVKVTEQWVGLTTEFKF